MSKRISVKSHVSRDFLQNAVYFNTLPKVVWEYVSNSLDNAKDNIPTTVAVEIRKEDDVLIIADNGSGMSRDDLERFFTMHGENIQRKRGKRVRGRFGTGKSAAFGIAKSLLIDTRCNGKRNVVSLHLEDIKKATSGDTFEVNEIVIDEKTDQDDGTIIEIKEFMTSRLDIDAVIGYIEKHLARYRLSANVVINGHTCKFKEPPAIQTITVPTPKEIEQHIGTAILTIKIAPFSLDQDERGIDILSEGVWHETTLGDVEGKELSERLFGEVDVSLLEQVNDDIPPFDNTRNNLLNRANPRVVILIAWISQELEKARQTLIEEEKERRKTEQAKKLEREAQRMADILNEDFKNLMMDLEVSRRITGKSRSKVTELNSLQGAILPGDGDQISEWQQTGQPHGHGHRGENPLGEGDFLREGPSLRPGESRGAQKESSDSGSKHRSGLFRIEFINSTKDDFRSRYKRDEHEILINLDHPQIALALKEGGGAQDSRHFLAMVYEVAAVEYAQAIQFERFKLEQVDAPDAVFAIGEAIDRVTRRFAAALQA